jgi:hypothetical protein
MATSKHTRSIAKRKKPSVGLMAIGAVGQWEVAIDESTSGRDRWFAQIEGPSVSLCFEIPSLGIVGDVLDFLEAPRRANGSPGRSGASEGSLVLITRHSK